MSDSPKKVAPKKKAAPKAPAEHPKYADMIKAAITSLGEWKGSSRQAISKYVKATYKVGETSDTHLKMALKRAVVAGLLVQVKGKGASGSFKLSDKAKAAKPKAKKPAAKKPAAKKATKKTPTKKKAATKKTPVKGKKKPAAKKSAKKPVAKKPAAKKAVKKTPKKKTAKKTAKK